MSKKNNPELVTPYAYTASGMVRALSKFFQFGNTVFAPLKGQRHDQLSLTQCGLCDGLKAKGWQFIKEMR